MPSPTNVARNGVSKSLEQGQAVITLKCILLIVLSDGTEKHATERGGQHILDKGKENYRKHPSLALAARARKSANRERSKYTCLTFCTSSRPSVKQDHISLKAHSVLFLSLISLNGTVCYYAPRAKEPARPTDVHNV